MLTSCSRFRSFPFRSAFFRPLHFRFLLLSLCFFLSSFFPSPSHSDLSGAASLPSGFLAFPLPLHPVSRASLPFLRTRLSVSFLSSFPVSLPQPLSRCFPSFPLPLVRFSSGLSPCFAFFRPLPLGSNYSAFRLSFPFFPFSPVGGSFGAVRSPCGSLALPLPSGLLPCPSSDSGTQLTALPFSIRYLASQWLPQRLGPPLRVLAFSPSLTRSGSGYLASDSILSDFLCCCLRDSLIIIPHESSNVNNFFKYFLYIFTIC